MERHDRRTSKEGNRGFETEPIIFMDALRIIRVCVCSSREFLVETRCSHKMEATPPSSAARLTQQQAGHDGGSSCYLHQIHVSKLARENESSQLSSFIATDSKMSPLRRYLRITKYTVLEVRIYLDNPALAQTWLLNPRNPVLPKVMEAIRPLVLPKLREEKERSKKKGSKKKSIKDVIVHGEQDQSSKFKHRSQLTAA